MKEIVIISGKGGTGKTTLTCALSALADNAVLADCDVDAADMHLIMDPKIESQTDFISGKEAVIDPDKCISCGICQEKCRFDAIREDFTVDNASCEGCGVCAALCPQRAVAMVDRRCGEWYSSSTRFGSMVHASMEVGAENSGRLVSLVRKEARKMAENQKAHWLIVDGPPGTGCPVIASITGCDAVVAVTEPTLSGIHDLKRLLKLTNHFNVPAYVCVNKWDLNPEISDRIESAAEQNAAGFLGKIPYTAEMTKAQIQGKSVTESGSEEIVTDIKHIWNQIRQNLAN